MRGRNLRRTLVAAGLVAASAVLVLVLAVAGLLAFIVTSAGAGSSWNASMDELSAALVRTEGGYAFTGGEYLAEKELWAMLVDEGGAVVWQQGKPADVPDRYSLTDVAAFTRWYLSDYPVQVRVREDGLLVAGGPKGSTWKHPFVLDMDVLKTIPFWFAGLFLLALLGVLGLTALVLGRQFRREQQERAMQPLRWGSLHPAALVRQVAADVLNGGLEERYALAVEVPPEAEALTLEGDASLLRRALLNLVNNCVRHNPEGCSITLTAAAEGEVCTLRVEDDGGGGLPVGLEEVGLAPDGGAAHGTGLRLVEQIARAHGGALELHRAARGVLAVLRLPL